MNNCPSTSFNKIWPSTVGQKSVAYSQNVFDGDELQRDISGQNEKILVRFDSVPIFCCVRELTFCLKALRAITRAVAAQDPKIGIQEAVRGHPPDLQVRALNYIHNRSDQIKGIPSAASKLLPPQLKHRQDSIACAQRLRDKLTSL